ncbi:MAG: hypothetical protein V4726_17600 [Verrucomicrobiota bacterium]
MKLNRLSIAGAGALWLGTLSGAYFFGKSKGTSDAGSASAVNAAGGEGSNQTAMRNRPGAPGTGSGAGIGADSGKPMALKAILAQMKEKMRGGGLQNPASMMKVMGLLDKIQVEDIPAALAEAESMTDPQQKMTLLMGLLGKWAETDGPAAMKYAGEHSSGLGMMAQMAKASVAGTWAEKDPEAVWKWYKDQGDKDTGGMMGGNLVLASLFSNLAGKDMDSAFTRLDEIEGAGRTMALAGIFQSVLFDPEKRDAVLKKLETLPEESERKQARQMMLSQWTMLSPTEATDWVKTQPQKEQAELRESMGPMLMMSDPKKGAAFMIEGATEEEKPKRYAAVVGPWARMDTNAAGTWLSAQPQGPHLDEARRSFVGAASERDPESAMAWAATITDEEKRVTATTTAYKAWKKKDAGAAESALANSGLSQEKIDSIKSPAEKAGAATTAGAAAAAGGG